MAAGAAMTDDAYALLGTLWAPSCYNMTYRMPSGGKRTAIAFRELLDLDLITLFEDVAHCEWLVRLTDKGKAVVTLIGAVG